jgi:hypothetical protein
MTANAIVVMVSERCRLLAPSIWGEMTTASRRIVRLVKTTRNDESLERSSGTCVIAAEREP